MSSRQRLKDAYFRSLAFARVDALVRRLRARRGQVVILNLHRVSPRPSPYWPPLTPEAFRHLVRGVVNTCDVSTFRDLDKPAGRRLRAVFSFDDGDRDFQEYAMPVLAEHGVSANQNVIVSSVETGRPPWTIALADALAAAPLARVRALRVHGFDCSVDETERSKVRFGTLLTNYLKSIPPARRWDVGREVQALMDDTSPDDLTQMLSRTELEAIGGTHELGGHSYSHESMEFLSDEEFEHELDRCDELFASLGRQMKIFAFPNGSYREGQPEALVRRGVRHVLLVDEALTTGRGPVHPRIPIYGDSAQELKMRAAGCSPSAMRRLMA